MFNAPNFDRIPANYSRNPIGTEEHTQYFAQRTLRDSNSVTLIILGWIDMTLDKFIKDCKI